MQQKVECRRGGAKDMPDLGVVVDGGDW